MTNAPDRSRQKLTPIFSTQDELEARMVQELLREADIESVVQAMVDHRLFPMNVGRMAQREILVLEADAAEASRILAERTEIAEQLEMDEAGGSGPE